MYCTDHTEHKNLTIFVWMHSILQLEINKNKSIANKHMYNGKKGGNGEPTEARLVVCRPRLVV